LADAARPCQRGDQQITSGIRTFLGHAETATAFFELQHERGVAIFFLISLGAFTISLIDFAREVRIALSEFDHYA